VTRRPGASPPLVLTLGEPGGIGPDITIDAWLRRRELALPPFLFAGDPALLRRRAEALGRSIETVDAEPEDAASAFAQAIPCLAGTSPVTGKPGELAASDAPAVVASIRASVALVAAGRAAAVVTNPIQKKALNAIGFPFPGHTEFLGALSAELFGIEAYPVMMLAGADLRVVPLTVHIPLREVPEAISADLIVRTGRIVARALTEQFGIAAPRIAVSGLNPHAGEEGMLGSEDAAIVAPGVTALRSEGIDAVGPLPADTMFHKAARDTYDAAICMYHDQALIPIKALAFDEAVNVTLGLPFIRTSPDHGTALSLAGTGKARPDSLVAALRLAAQMARPRDG
jgi:4-hydroxythreonine-4-phosphate dehydrogenase